MATQDFEIKWIKKGDSIVPLVSVDGVFLFKKEIERLAVNDGFSSIDDFLKWFNKDFEGQIIHWTKLRY